MVAVSRILDVNGQPLTLAEVVDEPQTAQMASLQNEWQSHPTRGLTPSRLAAILDDAERGNLVAQFDLFEDMEEKDAHLASEMGKRRRALQLDWQLDPPLGATPAEKKATARLSELLREIPGFQDMLFDLTDAIGKGFVNLEIEWQMVAGAWLPASITWRPQSWFTTVRGYTQEIHLRGPVGGVPLQPFGWITHIHRAKSGYIERTALFRQLVWPYLFKNYSVGDLAEFLEIYGIPMRIGKYPPNATEKEKATLLRALVQLGHNAAGIIPAGMALEFENVAQGTPDAFELMINWAEKSVSKAVLGGTLTSQADGKSSTNALGNVHNEVRHDLRDSDIRQVCSTITRDLLYPIAALNGLAPDGLRRCPRFRLIVQEKMDLATLATAVPPLVAMGVQIPQSWVKQRGGIPDVVDNEPVLNAIPVAVSDAAKVASTTAQLPAPARTGVDVPGQMAGQLDQQLQPATDTWINTIHGLVMRAQSLEEIRDGLAQLGPDMSLDDYANAMAQALSAAALAGRYDILREATHG